MAFTPKLKYKGRPLVRCKNDIYYGNFSDPFVIYMQVLTTKEDHGVQVADRIHVILLSTDTRKNPIERMQQQSMKNGLYSALEIGTIWLEKALKEAAKRKARSRQKKHPGAVCTAPGYFLQKKAAGAKATCRAGGFLSQVRPTG